MTEIPDEIDLKLKYGTQVSEIFGIPSDISNDALLGQVICEFFDFKLILPGKKFLCVEKHRFNLERYMTREKHTDSALRGVLQLESEPEKTDNSEEVNQKFKEKDDEISKLKNRLRNMEKEREKSKKQVNDLQQKNSELEVKVEKLNLENSRCKAKLLKLESEKKIVVEDVRSSTPTSKSFTWSPIFVSSKISLSSNNMIASRPSSNEKYAYCCVISTIGFDSGVHCWECELVGCSSSTHIMIGVAIQAVNLNTWLGNNANGWSWFGYNGTKYHGGKSPKFANGEKFGQGDVVGVMLDLTGSGVLGFYKNGRFIGNAFTGLRKETGGAKLFPALSVREQSDRVLLRTGKEMKHGSAYGSTPSSDTSKSFTWSPNHVSSKMSLSSNNMIASNAAGYCCVISTIGFNSGVHCWECELLGCSSSTHIMFGVAKETVNLQNWLGNDASGWSWFGYNGTKYHGGKSPKFANGEKFGQGDVVGVKLDLTESGVLGFYKNGRFIGNAFTGLRKEVGGSKLFPALSLREQSDRVLLRTGKEMKYGSAYGV